MIEISLTKGSVAIIDDADVDLVAPHCWHLHSAGYAAHKSSRSTIYMHRLILGAPKGTEVDHANGNRLDNRRENIRLANRSQQLVNQRRDPSKWGYRGVHFNSQRNIFQARVKYEGKQISLGCYYNAEDAARAYNLAAKALHKEFAVLNPVDGLPPIQARGISGFRGVYPYNKSNRFKAVANNKILGVFDDSVEAARCYDSHILAKDGVFGRLNFPLEYILKEHHL